MGFAICKLCKEVLMKHSEEDLNRCFKMNELAEWRKGDEPSSSSLNPAILDYGPWS